MERKASNRFSHDQMENAAIINDFLVVSVLASLSKLCISFAVLQSLFCKADLLTFNRNKPHSSAITNAVIFMLIGCCHQGDVLVI